MARIWLGLLVIWHLAFVLMLQSQRAVLLSTELGSVFPLWHLGGSNCVPFGTAEELESPWPPPPPLLVYLGMKVALAAAEWPGEECGCRAGGSRANPWGSLQPLPREGAVGMPRD